jgi:hypothetical protein
MVAWSANGSAGIDAARNPFAFGNSEVPPLDDSER